MFSISIAADEQEPIDDRSPSVHNINERRYSEQLKFFAAAE